MRKSTAILLSAVMVMSVVMPGLALGQTSDNEYSRTFESFPEHVLVNQENITGDFTLEVSTTGVPGREGDNVALTRGRYGPGSEQWIQFNNEKAYQNVTLTVTVHGSGTPKFANGSEFGATGAASNIVMFAGGTGGDRDLTCDSGEQISTMTNPFVNVVDCTAPVDNNVDENLDATQEKIDIYQSAQTQQAASESTITAYQNYLEDTSSQALILGKNAYIRALNNGSSQAAAETAAKQAVADYYATKQKNLLKAWDLQVLHYQYLHDTARNESGISAAGTWPSWGTKFVGADNAFNEEGTDYRGSAYYNGLDNQTLTLADGTTESVVGYSLEAFKFYPGSDPTPTGTNTWTPADADPHDFSYSGITHTSTGQLIIQPPNDNYDEQVYLDPGPYGDLWSNIQSQNSDAQSQIETLVNNTYSEYQAGEINNTDLIDPYVFAQEFSPGDEYQGWAAAQLTMLGTNSPEAMDSIGEFNISAESGNYSGILMSQENPASGQFSVNTTYDPSAINGTQYVVTDSEVHELTTNFTISTITTSSGETRKNVTIVNNTYETADVNTTELRQMYEDLAFLRAQIEAREQALGGGGGGPLAGLDTQSIAIIAAAGAAVLLLQN